VFIIGVFKKPPGIPSFDKFLTEISPICQDDIANRSAILVLVIGLNGDHLSMNQTFCELFGLVPIGLRFLRAVNAIEANLDFLLGGIQNGDGIPIGYVNDFALEVGGVRTA